MIFVPILLIACSPEPTRGTDEQIKQVAYRGDPPPNLTLYTVVNNKTGQGMHSALMIDGSQRVLFDPAGTWRHPNVPEQDDVKFGFSPGAQGLYEEYHARALYSVVRQTKTVSPETAERALALAKNNGSVMEAFCAKATGKLLQNVPGFEAMPSKFYPSHLMKAFAQLPDVETTRICEDDTDSFEAVLEQQSTIYPNK
ncbi:MAG: hypothetical protein ABJO67_12530 [Pseudoruegeria sp.]